MFGSTFCKLHNYHITTQNIEFDKIENLYTEAFKNMAEKGNSQYSYSYYKYFIPKNTKINIALNKQKIDVFFGIYCESACDFNIEIGSVGLFQKGSILSDSIRFINSIPVMSLLLEDEIIVETTEDSYLLFSLLTNEMRKFLFESCVVTGNFVCVNGYMNKDKNKVFYHYKIPFLNIGKEMQKYTLSIYANYSIRDKIKYMNKSQEFKEENGLILGENEKSYILKNFDLMDYYIKNLINNKNVL